MISAAQRSTELRTVKKKIWSVVFVVLFFPLIVTISFIFTSKTHAATYDLTDDSTYNLRYTTAAAWDGLSDGALIIVDLDGNGNKDILVGSDSTDNNSRLNSGSIYIIYDILFDDYAGTGNTIDLGDSSNYNLRYDAAVAGDRLSLGALTTADIDGNGNEDILVGAGSADNNSRYKSGSLYIIYDSLIDDYTGTGNNIDLAISSNYNLRYDGAVASDILSENALTTADIDGNGTEDILIGGGYANNNSRNNSGSLYIIYDSLIDDYSGTGNNIDLAASTNYNLRYDGAEDNLSLSYGAITTSDIDSNGKEDILLGSSRASYNSRTNSGSVWIIYDSLIDDYSGTGNTIDLADTSNYNLRYDGDAASTFFSSAALTTADIDSNGKEDLLVGAAYTSNNSRSDSGSFWIIYDSLIDDYSGTGNNIDLADTGNFNLRYDGPFANNWLSYGTLDTGDIDGNGNEDILVGTPYSYNNSLSHSGSLYVIYDSLIDDYTGTGNTIDLADTSNFNLRYDGPTSNGYFTFAENNQRQLVSDLNGDGTQDILAGAPYSDYGYLHIFYTFPHVITIDSNSIPTEDTAISEFTLTGSVLAPNSITNISGVQWSLGNDPLGTWTECIPDDSAFDSLSEDYSCDISGLPSDTWNVYARAYDENVSYTVQSNYPKEDWTYLVPVEEITTIEETAPVEEITEEITEVKLVTDTTPPNNSFGNTDFEIVEVNGDDVDEKDSKDDGGNTIGLAISYDRKPKIKFEKIEDDVRMSHYEIRITNTKDGSDQAEGNDFKWIGDITDNGDDGEEKDRDGFKIKYLGDKIEVDPNDDEYKLAKGTYYVKVRAVDTSGNHTDSAEIKLKVKSEDENPESENAMVEDSDTPLDITLQSIGQIPYTNQYSTYYYTSYLLTLIGEGNGEVVVKIDGEEVQRTNIDGDFKLNNGIAGGSHVVEIGNESFTIIVDPSRESFPEGLK